MRSSVDTRLQLNACLKQSHPERGINTGLIWKDVSDLPFFTLLQRAGFEPKAIECSPNQVIVNLKDCGVLMYKKNDVICGDENADGSWEKVKSMPSASNLLVPTDQTKKPKKWKTYQDMCNTAFSECLDQN